jgi:putative flavoprotein involved in K+ transport
MVEQVETVIVGGGQAGLAASYALGQLGRENIVLEQAAQAGNAWRNGRWDSFTLVTPNWSIRLPGAEYQGSEPDGYMGRNDLVRYFEQYVERYRLPVRYETRVNSIDSLNGAGFQIQAGDTSWKAKNVVVASGFFQSPRIPDYGRKIPADILQLHSGSYRNPDALPPGAVLVVGSAQSGCQIAEELYQSGRKVYLCVGGSSGRVPRRYRARDIVYWLYHTGFMSRTVANLPSPHARFAGNPQATGKNGGHTINLHQFYRDGVILLGRMLDVKDGKVWLGTDLKENLAKADQFEVNILKMIDAYIAKNGIEAPEEILPVLRDGYDQMEILSLDLKSAGISTVIWALGYLPGFNPVHLPVFDDDGFPVTEHNAARYPGLYFIGIPWVTMQKSGLLMGVGDDAAFIAQGIAGEKKVKSNL